MLTVQLKSYFNKTELHNATHYLSNAFCMPTNKALNTPFLK